MTVAVAGDHERRGLVGDHVGDRGGRGVVLERSSVTRPARKHAVVAGGQDFTILVEEMQTVERAFMRLPPAEILRLRQ